MEASLKQVVLVSVIKKLRVFVTNEDNYSIASNDLRTILNRVLVSAITHLVNVADSPSGCIVLVLYKERAPRWNHLKLLLSLEAATSILSV